MKVQPIQGGDMSLSVLGREGGKPDVPTSVSASVIQKKQMPLLYSQ